MNPRICRTYLLLLLPMVLILCCAEHVRAAEVLFVGADGTPTAGDDGGVMSHLQTLFGAGNVAYFPAPSVTPADAEGKNAIVISSTVQSADVRDKFQNFIGGVMNWESAIMDNGGGELQLTLGGGNSTTVDGVTDIEIVNDLHPIAEAAGVSLGPVTVYNSPDNMVTGPEPYADYGEGVVTLAAVGDRGALLAVEAGGALLGDGTPELPDVAAGRRVNFFIHDDGFNNLTATGLALFDASVQWVANDLAPPVRLTLRVDPVTGRVQIRNDDDGNSDSNDPITFSSYRITSAGNSLDASGWTPIESQSLAGFPSGDGSGNGWETAPNADAGELVEWYLEGDSTLEKGQSIDLGFAYDETVDSKDLQLEYSTETGAVRTAPVIYGEIGGGGLDGDFNGNNAVENADLTLLLNNWAKPVPPTPDGWIGTPPTAPAIDNDELTLLLNNWGQTVGGGSGSGQAADAVPEPHTFALGSLATMLAIALAFRCPEPNRGLS